MAVKRIRSTVDEREQKSLLMDLEVVMKSKGCPYIVMFNGAIFKVRLFRCIFFNEWTDRQVFKKIFVQFFDSLYLVCYSSGFLESFCYGKANK